MAVLDNRAHSLIGHVTVEVGRSNGAEPPVWTMDDITEYAESVVFDTNISGGFGSCTFTLRPPALPPEYEAPVTVDIDAAIGGGHWEGVVANTANMPHLGENISYSVTCDGPFRDYGRRSDYARMLLDREYGNWKTADCENWDAVDGKITLTGDTTARLRISVPDIATIVRVDSDYDDEEAHVYLNDGTSNPEWKGLEYVGNPVPLPSARLFRRPKRKRGKWKVLKRNSYEDDCPTPTVLWYAHYYLVNKGITDDVITGIKFKARWNLATPMMDTSLEQGKEPNFREPKRNSRGARWETYPTYSKWTWFYGEWRPRSDPDMPKAAQPFREPPGCMYAGIWAVHRPEDLPVKDPVAMLNYPAVHLFYPRTATEWGEWDDNGVCTKEPEWQDFSYDIDIPNSAPAPSVNVVSVGRSLDKEKCLITTASPHLLETGDKVFVDDVVYPGVFPDPNDPDRVQVHGYWFATVVGTHTFTVPCPSTVSGTGGTITAEPKECKMLVFYSSFRPVQRPYNRGGTFYDEPGAMFYDPTQEIDYVRHMHEIRQGWRGTTSVYMEPEQFVELKDVAVLGNGYKGEADAGRALSNMFPGASVDPFPISAEASITIEPFTTKLASVEDVTGLTKARVCWGFWENGQLIAKNNLGVVEINPAEPGVTFSVTKKQDGVVETATIVYTDKASSSDDDRVINAWVPKTVTVDRTGNVVDSADSSTVYDASKHVHSVLSAADVGTSIVETRGIDSWEGSVGLRSIRVIIDGVERNAAAIRAGMVLKTPDGVYDGALITATSLDVDADTVNLSIGGTGYVGRFPMLLGQPGSESPIRYHTLSPFNIT